jgi:hypothetical protein
MAMHLASQECRKSGLRISVAEIGRVTAQFAKVEAMNRKTGIAALASLVVKGLSGWRRMNSAVSEAKERTPDWALRHFLE